MRCHGYAYVGLFQNIRDHIRPARGHNMHPLNPGFNLSQKTSHHIGRFLLAHFQQLQVQRFVIGIDHDAAGHDFDIMLSRADMPTLVTKT